MTDKISLYYTAGSPPSRACINLARILNVEIELKNVNMLKGELQTEWFKQLNPVKKIPVMVYNGFILAESRAILAYIVNKWKPGSSWYPNNPEQRALIDQRMYFDATIVFPSLGGVVRSILYNIGDKEAVKKEVLSSLRLLESFLSKSEFFAGDTLTIADISILANITTFDAFGVNLSQFPKLNTWYKKLHSLQGFDENLAGAKVLAKILFKINGPIFGEGTAKL